MSSQFLPPPPGFNQSTGNQPLFEQPKLRRASEIADENLESLRNFSKIHHTILSRASKKKIRRQEQHQRLTSAQNLHKRYKSFEPKALNQAFERDRFKNHCNEEDMGQFQYFGFDAILHIFVYKGLNANQNCL